MTPFSWLSLARWIGIIAAFAFLYWMIFDQGADSVRNAIERQNNEAARNADDRRLNYDQCIDAGRVWDFGAGQCRRP